MPVSISSRIEDDVVVLDLSGRFCFLDFSLRETINVLLGESRRDFILNLTEVSYVDSFALGQLVAIWTSIRNRGGHMILLRPADRVLKLLQITKLDTVFPILRDEAQAIRSIRTSFAASA
jgi:anti-sigma B factor antagonist